MTEYKEEALRIAKEEGIEQVAVALFDVLDIETIAKNSFYKLSFIADLWKLFFYYL